MIDTEKQNILIVDDRSENLQVLEKLLKDTDVNVMKAISGNDALAQVLQHDFALILLDVQMPGMDGFEVAELMRNNADTSHIPIIFVTAINKEDRHIFKGYEAGAVDYLTKPLDPDILLSKVQVFLDLHKQKATLEEMNAELTKANKKILEQQKAVIEEERLKVLLQMAGATAHELNQPLMVLLGNIELMAMNGDVPEKLSKYITRIKDAGERISDTVKKIQTIRQYEVQTHDEETAIINIDQNLNILSVEDVDDDYQILEDILKAARGIGLSRATDIQSALVALEQNTFQMVLLDHPLKDGTGFDFMIELGKKGLDIPVVIITDQGDEMFASQMIQSGAYDYLTKCQLDQTSLLRTIDTTMEKARLKAEMKQVQTTMAEMSTRDELTGLFNRRYFNGVAEREISRARRYETELALCMVDLDHFKKTNDSYGHPAGDIILNTLGDMLKTAFRMSDVVCRYGGEEFAIVLPNTPLDHAVAVCERFRVMVHEHAFTYGDSRINVAVSIGVAALDPSESYTSDELVKKADQALYQAKSRGRNRVTVYSPTGFTDPVGSAIPEAPTRSDSGTTDSRVTAGDLNFRVSSP